MSDDLNDAPATDATIRVPAIKKLAKASTPEPVSEPRTPEVGDLVFYVDNRDRTDQILDATITAVFATGDVNLRVNDPSNAQGRFDVSHAEYDRAQAPGSWHFFGE